MKKTLVFFCLVNLLKASCLLIQENGKILKEDGDCAKRYAPCSTFKVAISLMGYDSDLLIDEKTPELPFKKGYLDWLDAWKNPINPSTWMKTSCVWYSQVITKKLGLKKFKRYLKKLHYGNQDASGDKEKNNGITNAWLSSSLEISPKEQADFLEKLINNKLLVNKKAQVTTQKLMYLEDMPHGWKLYGKTGSGNILSEDRFIKTDIKHGWFVGFLRKNERTIIFVKHIVDEEVIDSYAGLRAKEEMKIQLLELLPSL